MRYVEGSGPDTSPEYVAAEAASRRLNVLQRPWWSDDLWALMYDNAYRLALAREVERRRITASQHVKPTGERKP